MNTFLLRPYEDELMRSACARYLYRFNSKWIGAGLQKYLEENKRLSSHIPFHLGDLVADSHPWLRMSEDDWLFHHTLIPFMCTYLDRWRVAAAFSAISRGKSTSVLNGYNCKALSPSYRWCPECAKEDRDASGEAYWHRKHQIWGVDTCWKHDLCLLDIHDVEPSRMNVVVPLEALLPYDIKGFPRSRKVLSEPYEMLREQLVGLVENPRLNLSEISPYKISLSVQLAAACVISYRGSQGLTSLFGDAQKYWRASASELSEIYGGFVDIESGNYRDRYRVLANVVTRTMLGIYLKEEKQVSLDEILAMEVERVSVSGSIYFCPNPYAKHGDWEMMMPNPWRSKPPQMSVSCKECGMSVTVHQDDTCGKRMYMSDVISVNRFGDGWAEKVLELRAKGFLWAQISRQLGIKESSARALVSQMYK